MDISIIPEDLLQENQIKSKVDHFLKKHKIGILLKQSNFYKEKGFSCILILRFIFMLIFTGKNLYRTLESKSSDIRFSKNTVYRFLNLSTSNWRKLLLALSSSIINNILLPLTSKDRKNVLIIDDSVFSRNRSKAVELLARVFDHAAYKYVKGFRMLTLGWSDGNTFIPLAFSLLSSAKKKNLLCGINSLIDKRTNGYKRRKESIKKATEVMFGLLEQAKFYSISADYLLFDSWFAFPSVIKRALDYNLNVICMVKALPKIYYRYQGKYLNLKSLYKSIHKKGKRDKIIGSVIVEFSRKPTEDPVKAKIVFIRDYNESNQWLALLTTDIQLSEEEIVRIYGKRWDIEVFFKMSKSFLKLSKEFQGRSYDCMISHTTIVFMRYIMLALESRNNKDNKTIGGMFFLLCDELQDIKLIESLQLLIQVLKNTVKKHLRLTSEQFYELVSHFITSLPLCIKERLNLWAWES